jgi:hypothetical protein
MQEPKDKSKIYMGEMATFWFDEDGVLCAITNNSPRTIENLRRNFDFIRQITGDKKSCLLSDITHSAALDKKAREFSAEEFPKLFKAMAIYSSNDYGKLVADPFIVMKEQSIPIKYFSDEYSAREWLVQYL